jgi:hypothetical protein
LGEQELGSVVVELAGDPAALLLLGADDLAGERAELGMVAGELVEGRVQRLGEVGHLDVRLGRDRRSGGQVA